MKKILYTIISVLLVSSCNLTKNIENIYPEDITIEGYGTLKFDETISDNNSISELFISDQKLWFASSKEFGGDTSIQSYDLVTNSIQIYITENIIDFGPKLLGEYVIFISVPLSPSEASKLKLINNATGEIVVRNLPETDRVNTNIYNNSIYIKYSYSDTYYKSDDHGSTWTSITIEEFESSNIQKNNIYVDSSGIQYRIIDESYNSTKTFLEVSTNGTDWHRSNLGTNYGRDIVVFNEKVYISCNWYYDSYFAMFPGPYTGGGLHVFKWDK